ncbi:MAG TPA: 50S ribosomal protein L32 [Anaerolineaceae bacterium]|nr:50S ribosomal protein L32 [Anaerolineaceae bacterium]HOO58259.1 50S ribosomal protein L32 [Anaerolineaceae bacterium]
MEERKTTPLPKRKSTSGRRDRRRVHDALKTRNSVTCPNCGYYQGREVLIISKE